MGKASTFFVITALLVAGVMADQDLDEYGDYYQNYSLSANDTVGEPDWLDELDEKITEIVSNATNSSLDCY